MNLAVTSTDAFATGTIANTGLGSRLNKSFATGFQGQLIQISQSERIEIDEREKEARNILLSQGIEVDFDGGPKGFPKTKVDFLKDKEGNLILQNGLPVGNEVSSWYDVRHMIARNTFEEKTETVTNELGIPLMNPITGKPKLQPKLNENGEKILNRVVKIDEQLLKKSLFATIKLKEIGITSISAPKYRPGTTVIEALEIELEKNTKGITTNALKKEGLTLSNFPRATSIYQALKMIEESNLQGVVNSKKAKELVRDVALLRAEEIFTLKRFKPFGGDNPTSAVALLNEQPEKFRPTPAEENFKPLWKTPPSLEVDLGKISTQQWRNAVVQNAIKVNPAYSEEEIIAKFGFDRIMGLGSGWYGRNG
jgi:hypothetical protein